MTIINTIIDINNNRLIKGLKYQEKMVVFTPFINEPLFVDKITIDRPNKTVFGIYVLDAKTIDGEKYTIHIHPRDSKAYEDELYPVIQTENEEKTLWMIQQLLSNKKLEQDHIDRITHLIKDR